MPRMFQPAPSNSSTSSSPSMKPTRYQSAATTWANLILLYFDGSLARIQPTHCFLFSFPPPAKSRNLFNRVVGILPTVSTMTTFRRPAPIFSLALTSSWKATSFFLHLNRQPFNTSPPSSSLSVWEGHCESRLVMSPALSHIL